MSYTVYQGALPYGIIASELGITDKTAYERIGWDYEEKQTVPVDGGYATIVPQILAFEPTEGQVTINASFITTIVTKNPEYIEGGTASKYLFANTYDRSKDKQVICNKYWGEIESASEKEIGFFNYLEEGEIGEDSNGLGFMGGNGYTMAMVMVTTPFEESEKYYLNSVNTDLDELFEDESVTSVNLYTPVLDITIDYLYKQPKLDGDWVDIDPVPAVSEPIYIDNNDQVALRISNQYGMMGTSYSCLTTISPMWSSTNEKSLAVDRSTLCQQIAGDGIESSSSTLKVKNASQTSIGGIKIAVSGDTLYISNDGNDPIR